MQANASQQPSWHITLHISSSEMSSAGKVKQAVTSLHIVISNSRQPLAAAEAAQWQCMEAANQASRHRKGFSRFASHAASARAGELT
jgi:hypothetical protein